MEWLLTFFVEYLFYFFHTPVTFQTNERLFTSSPENKCVDGQGNVIFERKLEKNAIVGAEKIVKDFDLSIVGEYCSLLKFCFIQIYNFFYIQRKWVLCAVIFWIIKRLHWYSSQFYNLNGTSNF